MFLVISAKLFSQDPFYYRIDRSKGLPSNTVYDVFQDSKGFIWFSGLFGLCRYDGREFLTYEASHLASKAGAGIKQDATGRIWYCNFDGKLLYVEGGRVLEFKHNSEFGFYHFAIINNFLYVVESDAIALYDVVTLSKKHVIPFKTSTIVCTHGSSNRFYIVADKLHIISGPSDIQEVEFLEEMKQKLVGVMMQNVGDDLLLLSKYSNVAYLYRNGVFEVEKLVPHNFIQNLSAGNNRFWLSTTNGIVSYEHTLNSKERFSQTYLMDNNVSDVLEDNNGHLWFSTLDKGVRFIPDMHTKFIYSEYAPTVLQAFENQKILVGNDLEDLYVADFDNFSTKTLFQGKTNHAFYYLYLDAIANRIFATSNTFKMFDLQGNLMDEKALALKEMVKIEDDVYAYSATWQCGLLKLSNAKSDWDSVFSSINIAKSGSFEFKPIINNVRGKSVAYLKSANVIYFSSNKGLFKVTKNSISEVKLNHKSLNVVKLIAYQNILLAFTANAQLFKIDQADSIVEIDLRSTLTGQSPTSIKLLDNDLFIFTKNSVFRYDINHNSAQKIVSINDDFEWHDIALLNKKIILSTSKGYIVTSHTNKIQYSKPVFVIDSILNGDLIQRVKEFVLVEADKPNVSVYFSHVCFNPDNESFVQYRINGGQWFKITDNRNVIDFEKLKPGKYSVEFIYGNGFENSEVSVLDFEVQKPFWLKWWFIALIIFLFVVFLYNFDKWRTKRINRKSSEIIARINLEKAANQSKLKALKSQMNPHFFFNALNTIQSFILENDKKMAIGFLSKFSNLTRSILEMSDKDEVSVAEEIKVLKLYLDIEKVRFNDDFEYEISTNDFDSESFRIPSLLLQPYVENAIKHGLLHKTGPKRLNISFNKEPQIMRIVISDNGIGRKKSMELNAIKNKKHYSFATQAIEKRVKLLNEFTGKEITVEYVDEALDSERVTGTTVILKIPIEVE